MTGIEQLRDLARNMRHVGYAWAEDLADDLDSIADQIERLDIKLLDADGVEIRVGDVLYLVEANECVTVMSVYGRCSFVDQNGSHRTASYFTHRAPALAADGKPLLEGEMVRGINGGRYRLTGARDGEVFARHVGGSFGAEVESAGGGGLYRLRADHLIHERPDNLKSLEEDAKLPPLTYCIKRGIADMDATDADNARVMATDLVRRFKALQRGGWK